MQEVVSHTDIVLDLGRLQEIDKIEDYNQKLHRAAIYYASAGLKVIPIPPGEKRAPKYSEANIQYVNSSRSRPIVDRWFNPVDGKYKGWNIGIVCGGEGGLFVVDLDIRSDGVDGVSIWNNINKDKGLVTPTSKTPSGGKHLVFLWEPGAIGSTSKIARGIDTRGGSSATQPSSHINAFPSVVDGEQYTWTVGGAIPAIPEWLRDKMGMGSYSAERFSKGTGRGNENVSKEDEQQPLPMDQIERMIASIDPDELSYDEWLRLGQSINSQLPGDEGLAIWDEWSKKGKRYKHGECIVRWKGFDPTGAVGGGTLFFMAKEKGWAPTEKDVTGKSMAHAEIVERLNKTFAIVLVGGKIRVLRERLDDNDLVMGHYDLLGKDDFFGLLSNEKIQLGKSKISVGELWWGHESRRTYPNGLILCPDNVVPNGAYNTWNGFALKPIAGECEVFKQHIFEVICSGNKEYYDWVLDWCAHAFQFTASPPGTALVLRGKEGTGKGTFADTIGRMFGSHYRHLIDDSHLTSNFNAHLIDALFVFADEITWGGNKKTSGKLKGLVTERYLIGERKGVDAIPYRNMIRMIVASNEEWVIPAGGSSRRWFVLDVSDIRMRDRRYFEEINDTLDNGGREAFLHEMINREITSDLSFAPETEALNEQRAMSSGSDSILQWWISCIIEGKINAPHEKIDEHEWPIEITKANLYKAYEVWCLNRNTRPLTQMKFWMKLKSLGIQSARLGNRVNRKYVSIIPPRMGAIDALKRNFNISLLEAEDE